MIIDNRSKAEIPFRHKDLIQRYFNSHIKGNLGISHFSINVFFGNGESIFLSPTPKMASELCKKNFVDDDTNYKPEIYSQYSIYPWRAVALTDHDKTINFIKEEKFNMNSGMMLVRNLGLGRYVMYSIATNYKNNPEVPGQFCFLFHCKANQILKMGDFLYENMRPIINEYGEQVNVPMPKIDSFQPIHIESGFVNNEQKELFLQSENSNNLLQFPKVKKRSLELINGGRVRSVLQEAVN